MTLKNKRAILLSFTSVVASIFLFGSNIQAFDFNSYNPAGLTINLKNCQNAPNGFGCILNLSDGKSVQVGFIKYSREQDAIRAAQEMEDPDVWEIFQRGSGVMTLQEVIFTGSAFVKSNFLSEDQRCSLIDDTFEFVGITDGNTGCNTQNSNQPDSDILKLCPKNAVYFPLSEIKPIFGRGATFNSSDHYFEVGNPEYRNIPANQPSLVSGLESGDVFEDMESVLKEADASVWSKCSMTLLKGKHDFNMHLATTYMSFSSEAAAKRADPKFFNAWWGYYDSDINGQSIRLLDKPKIGDEGWFYAIEYVDEYDGKKRSLEYILLARKNSTVQGVAFDHESLEESRKTQFDYPANKEKARQLLEKALGINPVVSSPPVAGAPQILQVLPGSVSAGIASYNNQSGVVSFTDNNLILRLEGNNLSNVASLQVNNPGIDGRPGIEFRQIQVNKEGTILQAQMIVKPTAKDGINRITLTNNKGQAADFNLNVTITGNQYLNRKFSGTSLRFYGEWPTINEQVEYLASEIAQGVDFINKGEYRSLGIILYIFETKFWNEVGSDRYCNTGSRGNNSGFGTGGCAVRNTPYIYLREFAKGYEQSMKEIIVHEAAHKLHAYYTDIYSGRIVRALLGGFQSRWKSAVGNISGCRYLPITNANWKNETDASMPRCGFAMAYGATNLRTYSEDIATFTQLLVMRPQALQRGDGLTDSRYGQKTKILKDYGFTP